MLILSLILLLLLLVLLLQITAVWLDPQEICFGVVGRLARSLTSSGAVDSLTLGSPMPSWPSILLPKANTYP